MIVIYHHENIFHISSGFGVGELADQAKVEVSSLRLDSHFCLLRSVVLNRLVLKSKDIFLCLAENSLEGRHPELFFSIILQIHPKTAPSVLDLYLGDPSFSDIGLDRDAFDLAASNFETQRVFFSQRHIVLVESNETHILHVLVDDGLEV